MYRRDRRGGCFMSEIISVTLKSSGNVIMHLNELDLILH